MGDSTSRIILSFVGCLLAAPSAAQVTERVTVATDGTQGDQESGSTSGSVISADGRFVAFISFASNLVPADTNWKYDIFVRDRQSGTTRRVSVASDGAQGDGSSLYHSISADGRYVAFDSDATNLVPGDTNGVRDVFVHDLQTGATTRVSVDSSGFQGGGETPSISADGRYVAFQSDSANLVPGDTNGQADIFVHDRVSGVTARVSVSTSGAEGNGSCRLPSISANGRYVAFLSAASDLVVGDTNVREDVFVRDRHLGTTDRVSLASDGSEGNGFLSSTAPSISADGRYVEFISSSTNLVPGDTNGGEDVYVRDRQTSTTERVSIGTNGSQGVGTFEDAWMSTDGRYVAFSDSGSLVPGDANGSPDIFVRDRQLGTTERVSVATDGGDADRDCIGASISATGRYVVFDSYATNLVPGDNNGWLDGFVCDRDATGFTSLCEPGAGGVIACPCSNPPSGPGSGCDNHGSTTGGAALEGSGIASLSSDSVLLSVGRENSTALTVFWTGINQISPPGVAHGAGVRCVSGLHRLYSGSASGGFISRPSMGDPSVSQRSSAVGAPITAGEVRYYFTIYRDPQAATPCGSTSSTVNLSNAVSTMWAP